MLPSLDLEIFTQLGGKSSRKIYFPTLVPLKQISFQHLSWKKIKQKVGIPAAKYNQSTRTVTAIDHTPAVFFCTHTPSFNDGHWAGSI